MKRLPIGVAVLDKIINDNYLYVDKTRFIANLVTGGECYFLSRPRRFGKSLFMDTLKQAFLGNKALFKGLYLENHWDWENVYPVIHLSFGGGSAYNSQINLLHNITGTIKEHADKYKVAFEEDKSYGYSFSRLIRDLYAKHNQRVVLLIDEYDKPILDVIDDSEQARTNREILKGLYGFIKDNDQYLKFVFITGVSRFSKSGLFSGLNSLNDIILDQRYADICGYTQANIENELSDRVKLGSVDLAKLKHWYNGYNFVGNEAQKVYNPFDILLFFDKNYTYDCYWFKTGTPSFLIKILKQNQFDDLGNVFASHFSSIPHNWYTSINNYEGFYASIVYSLLCGLGYDCIPEDISNIGRMDFTIQMPDKVIIIEFKLSNRGDASDALQQIKDRAYANKYVRLKLPIYIVGISFDPKTKNLADYKWELLQI